MEFDNNKNPYWYIMEKGSTVGIKCQDLENGKSQFLNFSTGNNTQLIYLENYFGTLEFILEELQYFIICLRLQLPLKSL
jgi:hypothetical protein